MICCISYLCFFFFQAEDGIRDIGVTGVQTCALPIFIREKHDAAQAEIEKLRLLIRQLQRGRFGRRSERLEPDQLQLGLEDLEQTAAAAEAAQEAASRSGDTPRPSRSRRRNLGALPAHLPRGRKSGG